MKTKKLTKVERRLIILKDVLSQIRSEQYKVTQGEYVKLPLALRRLVYNNPKRLTGQTCLLDKKTQCKVCAKGAIFLSIVRKENKVSVGELTSSRAMTSKYNILFGEENMNKVEAAFEKWYYLTPYGDYKSRPTNIFGDPRLKDEAITRFSAKYPDKTERLKAIIKNMIKNEGVFKP